MDQHVQERRRETGREPHGIHDIEEGHMTKTLERQTARIPSTVYLLAAGASIVGSLVLQFMGRRERSLFVGQWAPTFLLLGIYNKQVKTQGHD